MIAAGHAVCWFHEVTHLACPTCGMTRAFAALARGDIGASLGLHPMAIVFVAQLAVGGVLWVRGFAAGGVPTRSVGPGGVERHIPKLVAANAAALLALWLGRLATGTLPG